MKRVILKVYGQVQGVFFRVAAKEKADELGLIGWVRNEEDESVKIVAEGEEKVLQKLIDWCYNGSKYSKVNQVSINWEEGTGEFDDFQIKY